MDTVNRKELAGAISTSLSKGVELLKKPNLGAADIGKINIIKTLNATVANGVAMMSNEIAQDRNNLVAKKLESLGYPKRKSLK